MGIKSFFSKLFGKEEEQIVEEPIELAPQKTDREMLLDGIRENVDKINDFFDNPQKYEGARFNALETKAIFDIYKKMLKAFKHTNNYTNFGFRNVDEYYELKRIIQDLINAKDQNVRNLVPEFKVKLDELAMALRATAYELNKNFTDRRKIQEILESDVDRKRFFEYSVKFKEATDIIRKRLFG